MRPKLSILIPSVPSRIDKVLSLYNRLNLLIGDKPIEVLAFTDNKKRSIGKKREALVKISNGEYIAFLDDDDDFFDEYVDELLLATEQGTDVITFKQKCTIDGKICIVDFDLNYTENEEVQIIDGEYKDVKRMPFHICAWKSDIAKSEDFPDVGYGEDWNWCERLLAKTKTQYKINKVLHHYIFDNKVTEAPTESNEVWNNPNN